MVGLPIIIRSVMQFDYFEDQAIKKCHYPP
jgi:hypothetical protein